MPLTIYGQDRKQKRGDEMKERTRVYLSTAVFYLVILPLWAILLFIILDAINN